jgi:hypothetical protein
MHAARHQRHGECPGAARILSLFNRLSGRSNLGAAGGRTMQLWAEFAITARQHNRPNRFGAYLRVGHQPESLRKQVAQHQLQLLAR